MGPVAFSPTSPLLEATSGWYPPDPFILRTCTRLTDWLPGRNYMSNQQFSTSHLVFVNCKTAVQIHWDWAWTMQDFVIESCGIGLNIVGGVSLRLMVQSCSHQRANGLLYLPRRTLTRRSAGWWTNEYRPRRRFYGTG